MHCFVIAYQLFYTLITVCMPIRSYEVWLPPHHRFIPQDLMVDVINNVALKLLSAHNEINIYEENIAISPYGLVSLLVALEEGLRGPAADEIFAHLPPDPSIIRVGLRDIHRHLKSYFISSDGFLSGLNFNHDNIILNPGYKEILQFYGYDVSTLSNKPNISTTLSTTMDSRPTDTPSNVVTQQSVQTTDLNDDHNTDVPYASFITTDMNRNNNSALVTTSTSNTESITNSLLNYEYTSQTTSVDSSSNFVHTISPQSFSPTSMPSVNLLQGGEPLTSTLRSYSTEIEISDMPTSELVINLENTMRIDFNNNIEFQHYDLTTGIPERYESLTNLNINFYATESIEDKSGSSSEQETTFETFPTSQFSAPTTQLINLASYAESSTFPFDRNFEQLSISTTFAPIPTTASKLKVEVNQKNEKIIKDRTVSATAITNPYSSTTEDIKNYNSISEDKIIHTIVTFVTNYRPQNETYFTTIVDVMDDLSTSASPEITTSDVSTFTGLYNRFQSLNRFQYPNRPEDTTPFLDSTIPTSDQNISRLESLKNELAFSNENSGMTSTESFTEHNSVTNSEMISSSTFGSTLQDYVPSEDIENTTDILILSTSSNTIAAHTDTTSSELEVDQSTDIYTTLSELQENNLTNNDISTSDINTTTNPTISLIRNSIDDFKIANDIKISKTKRYINAYSNVMDLLISKDQILDSFTYTSDNTVERNSVGNMARYQTTLPFTYIPFLHASAIRFPLDNPNYYLLVLLPDENVNELMFQLLENVNHSGTSTLRTIVGKMRYTNIDVIIPNFMLSGTVNLTPTVRKMGIKRIFHPMDVDFSFMTPVDGIYVTSIEQTLKIRIRSYAEISSTSHKNWKSSSTLFTVDKPFLFFVMDNELDVCLVTGKVGNPLKTTIH